MRRPNIKLILFVFLGIFVFVLILIFPQGMFTKGKVSLKKANTEGRVLGEQVYSSPTPAPTSTPTPIKSRPTPTPTPTPSPTPSPASTQTSPSPAPKIKSPVAPTPAPSYPGPPLPQPLSKKELLVLNFDSTPQGGWEIKGNEGTTTVSGKVGQALSVSSGKLILKGGETFAPSGTLSFWIKLEGLTNHLEASILDWNFDGTGRTPSLFEILVVDDKLYFITYDESADQVEINGQISPFEWHQVAVTWDVTKEPYHRTLYIDKKKIASLPFTFAPKTYSPSVFQIGGKIEINSTTVPFMIDQLELLNWAKSEEEI